MFRMMIVDDEVLVRKGIATSIDWADYGIVVVDEAGNGNEALRKLSENQVDLVLTDIRMPIMSGIELARLIKQHYPDIAVVLLSGYEDFSYAKAAMQIGVQNYLLKPASADELVSVITKIRDKKRDELLNKSKEVNKNQIFNENLPYIKFTFMRSLLKMELDPTEIAERLKTLKIHLNGPQYHILIVNIDDFLLFTANLSQKEKEAYKYAILNITEETILSYLSGFVCYGELDELIALVATNKTYSILDVCEKIQLNIRKHLKLSVTIGIGLPCSNLAEIDKSYMEAIGALKNKAFQGKGKVFLYSRDPHMEKVERLIFLTSEEKDLVQHLKLLNVSELHQAMHRFFSRFVSQNVSFDEVKHACVRLIIFFSQAVEEMGILPAAVFGASFIPHVTIERFEIMGDLQAWMLQMLGLLISGVEENQKNNFKKIVKKAIHYMEKDYSQPIGLNDVAKHVYVTPTYFSKLFKEETGVTFIKWLNQLRVEKAKSLLKETWLKTYEIAEMVGYNDYKYFSNTFKKHTGYSPADYRNR